MKNFKISVLFLVCPILSFSPLLAQPTTPSTNPIEELRPQPSKQDKTKRSEDEISDWIARLELARVLSYMQRYDESLKEYQKLLREDPESPIAKREMAAVLFYIGDTKEAMKLLSQIPDKEIDPKTRLIIADILVKEEDYPAAEKIYRDYLEKSPKEDKVRLKLASLLSWEKRYKESIDQYLIILSHQPDDIQVRRRYAQVLTWMGEDEEAIKEWKKTLP